jgi:hypothetical protein
MPDHRGHEGRALTGTFEFLETRQLGAMQITSEVAATDVNPQLVAGRIARDGEPDPHWLAGLERGDRRRAAFATGAEDRLVRPDGYNREQEEQSNHSLLCRDSCEKALGYGPEFPVERPPLARPQFR